MTEQQLIDLTVIAGCLALFLLGWWLGKADTKIRDRYRWVPEPFTHVRVTHTNDKCPVCHHDTIEGDSFDYEGSSEVTQGMWCLDCDAEWLDVYTLTRQIRRPSRV